MEKQPQRDERFDLIMEDLKLLTPKQIDILRGFISQCINKNLMDEIRAILEGSKEA